MSYSITPDGKILQDGKEVGHITGNTCYMENPPKGRGIAKMREVLGQPHLRFEGLGSTLDDVKILPVTGAITDGGGEVQTIAIPVLPEPPNNPHLGDKDPVWQRWFIATHGEDAFKSRWPHRQLPQ